MRQYPIFLASVLSIFFMSPAFADDTPDIETVVDLDLKHYPPAKGNYDAYQYAAFVKKRNALAKKLYKAKKLDDAVTVLKGLIKHNSNLTLEKYDLGAIYYEQATIAMRQYQKLSLNLENATKSGDKAKINSLKQELKTVDRRAKKKASYALAQFKSYQKRPPNDARAADSIWRCYMLLERYEKAVEALDVVIQWKDLLDKKTKQQYLALRARLVKNIEDAKKEKDAKKVPSPQKDKAPEKKESKDN